MRGCAGAKRSCFMPIIDSLLDSPKMRLRDRSNRLLEAVTIRAQNKEPRPIVGCR
jgi:hypothetical protein